MARAPADARKHRALPDSPVRDGGGIPAFHTRRIGVAHGWWRFVR
jgi:hypothetical protein